mmetsp:Transcript_1417/g.1911  ORF Transcript_1417/g.1911 Transcript_1417/m.1911 type:complete len:430 (+) Transcript_1417:16-1305(+)
MLFASSSLGCHRQVVALVFFFTICITSITSFTPTLTHINAPQKAFRVGITTCLSSSSSSTGSDNDALSKAPTFNGNVVFPVKAVMPGLAGHKVAAAYAIYGKNYKRGEEGWNLCQHVSITRDLHSDLTSLVEEHNGNAAYVRALSFAYPQKSAMQEVANRWKEMVERSGGILEWANISDDDVSDDDDDGDAGVTNSNDEMSEKEKLIQLMKDTAFYDDDDDDDEDDDEFDVDEDELSSNEIMDAIGTTKSDEPNVVSPFEKEEEQEDHQPIIDSNGKLEFNKENVNKVLDEVRPYLINDGGNVSVQRVDAETRSVYLVLEGACGSCPSSTVTMQMGIQRVLDENFDNLGEVLQVDDQNSGPKDLTMDAVTAELNRIGPAITAMGGNIELVNVDPLGVVELKFRGSTKVQQGLELAIRDVPLVKHVKFVN